MDVILVWILLGGAVGFYLGRVWAEHARATHDMKRVWEGQQVYRKKR